MCPSIKFPPRRKPKIFPYASSAEKRPPYEKGAGEEQLLKLEEQPKEEIPFFNGDVELCQKSAILGQILWCFRRGQGAVS